MYIVATGTLGRYMVVVCRRAEVKPEPPSNNSSQHRESRSQPNITPQWVVQIGGKMIVNKTRIIIVYSVFKDPLQTCFKMYIKHFALIHNVVLISIFPSNSSVVRKKKTQKNITAFLSLKTQILLKSQFSTQKHWIRSYLNVRLVYSSRKVVFILKYIWYQVLCFTRVIFLHDIFTFPLVWPMRTLYNTGSQHAGIWGFRFSNLCVRKYRPPNNLWCHASGSYCRLYENWIFSEHKENVHLPTNVRLYTNIIPHSEGQTCDCGNKIKKKNHIFERKGNFNAAFQPAWLSSLQVRDAKG